MAKTRLEYKDKASQKFWEVSAAGSTINIKYGRLGTKGQNSVKKMSTPEAAKKEKMKTNLINQAPPALCRGCVED